MDKKNIKQQHQILALMKAGKIQGYTLNDVLFNDNISDLTKPQSTNFATERYINTVETIEDVEKAQSEFNFTIRPKTASSKYLIKDVKNSK